MENEGYYNSITSRMLKKKKSAIVLCAQKQWCLTAPLIPKSSFQLPTLEWEMT